MTKSSSRRGCNASPQAPPHRFSKVQNRGETPENSAPQGAAELTDSEWATEAWTAIVRSLCRCRHVVDSSGPERAVFITRYTKRSEEGTAMKWLKFHLSYIFAYSTAQDELPTPPGQGEPGEITLAEDGSLARVGLIGGDIGRTIREHMNRGRSGNWGSRRICLDLMMAKIGMPAAPQRFQLESLQGHFQALTKKTPHRTEEQSDLIKKVRDKIDEIARSLFKGQVMKHTDHVPSGRACFERSITDGGAMGELLCGFNEHCHQNNLPSEFTCLAIPCLISMTETQPAVVESLYFREFTYGLQRFQDNIDKQWRSRLDKPISASPVPICEPLKVRMITKGQAAEYYRCIEIQKMMHGVLSRHPVFEYIGHPIDEESWAKCFKTQDLLAPDQFYVSGDYKGATDNLDPSLSEWAWRCISSYAYVDGEPIFDTPYYLLGKKALTGHELHYPQQYKIGARTVDTGLPETVMQSWGQLMGSPMSFPILCLVNCAATLVALDQSFTRDLQMKVNGDDIAFITNKEGYENWKKITCLCGLEFSLGKNYTSRQFIVMNSELRRVPLSGTTTKLRPGAVVGDLLWTDLPRRIDAMTLYEPEEEWFEDIFEPENSYLSVCVEITHYTENYNTFGPLRQEVEYEVYPKEWTLEGFVNQSLLYRRVKKGQDAGKEKDVYWTDLQSLSHELLRGIPQKYQSALMKEFLNVHADIVRELPAYCNKWLPTRLGGAGLCIPKGEKLEDLLSSYDPKRLELQLKQAAYLACNDTARAKRVTRSLPITGILGECLRGVLTLSNTLCRPVLAEKPLNRNQKTILGGSTFLGYLISSLPVRDYKVVRLELQRQLKEMLEENNKESALCWNATDRVCTKSPYMVYCQTTVELLINLVAAVPHIGGGFKSESSEGTDVALHHRKEALYLNQKYQNWLRKGNSHSLGPMNPSTISLYQEHLAMVPRLQLLRGSCSNRSLQLVGKDVSL